MHKTLFDPKIYPEHDDAKLGPIVIEYSAEEMIRNPTQTMLSLVSQLRHATAGGNWTGTMKVTVEETGRTS